MGTLSNGTVVCVWWGGGRGGEGDREQEPRKIGKREGGANSGKSRKNFQHIYIIFCTQGGGELGVKGRGNPIVGSVQVSLCCY